MSRNSSGTYTLPVADKAPLQVIPAADWNSLFNDLKTEMTDSLNRSGKGGMLAPLELAAGTEALPGITFVLEPSSGLYRAGAGDIRMSLLDTDILKFTAGAVAVTGTLAVSGATTLTGGIATATTATGNFTMSNAAGPALFDEAATITNPTLLPNKSDTDTGIGWSSANVGILIAGGTSLASFSPTAFSMINAAGSAMMNEAATATNPTLLPNKADADSGLGWVSSNTLSFITAGIERYRLSLSGLQINVPLISTNTSDATSTSTGSIRTGGGIASTKDIFAGADIVLTGGLLAHNATTSTVMSGGTTATLGGNVVTYGETHASLANDIQFRSGSTILAAWDESDDQWEFKKDVLFETDIVVAGSVLSSTNTAELILSGGLNANNGANLTLNASNRADSLDFDIVFREGSNDLLIYDHSDTQWEFKKAVVFEANIDISGNINVDTNINISGSIRSKFNTETLLITGDSSTATGGAIDLHGSNSGSDSNDIDFKSAGADVAIYDASESQWEFKKDVLFEQAVTADLATGAIITLNRSDATIVANDILGSLNFTGDDAGSGDGAIGARIIARADGTWDSADIATRLEFLVAPDGGAIADTVCMALKEDGQVSFPLMLSGTTQPAGTAAGELWFDTDDGNTVKVGV